MDRRPWWLPIVAFNLVPVVGVLALGWDLGLILICYWVENGLVGAENLVKILTARGRPWAAAAGGPPFTLSGSFGALARLGTAAFFTLHYGMFWVVHGIFVSLIASGAFFGDRLTGDGPNPFPTTGPGLLPLPLSTASLPLSFWVAVGGLAILRLLDLLDWFRRGEDQRVSPSGQMGEPYRRVIVLHVTIVLGGLLVATLGQPLALLLVLVVVKILTELGLERRTSRART